MFTDRFIFLSLFIFILASSACKSVPKGSFIPDKFSPPDYSQQKYWAALPGVKDSADAVPLSSWRDEQANSPIDVFFIHPTTYTGKGGEKRVEC